MNFIIKTIVESTTKEWVIAGFTSTLFLKLAPPFPRLEIVRFDGSEKGNEIHLQMDFIILKQRWVSVIIENGKTDTELYFVDEGTTLPSPLKTWKHRHVIRQINSSVEIEDNVTYSSGNKLIDYLLFPFLYALLFYRKPIYKDYFRSKK